ncbi:hypothetical protein EYF80_060230 [Liparis tanakae]|uniref:Uncharacterized protein n=1 Tax=Liparis tanakae TaxID=230148 RepID=A0A4Z2EMM4_9TELE|nr:hypothetical protein EYF80_060230 [Liparis tanakae]
MPGSASRLELGPEERGDGPGGLANCSLSVSPPDKSVHIHHQGGRANGSSSYSGAANFMVSVSFMIRRQHQSSGVIRQGKKQ